MQQADRGEFDAQIRLLFAGFNQFMRDETCEAYWLALNKFPLITIIRAVEFSLSDKGPETVPKAPKLREIAFAVRSQSRAPGATAKPAAQPDRQYDDWHTFGQRRLLAFLRAYGPFSEPTMQALVAEKNRLLEQWKIIEAEEPIEAAEVFEALHKGFMRILERTAHVPAPAVAKPKGDWLQISANAAQMQQQARA